MNPSTMERNESRGLAGEAAFPAETLQHLRAEAKRLMDHVTLLAAVKAEEYRYRALRLAVLAFAVLLGALAACAMTATGVVFVANGLARGLSSAFPPVAPWSELIIGVVFLGLLGSTPWIAAVSVRRSARRRLELRKVEGRKGAGGAQERKA